MPPSKKRKASAKSDAKAAPDAKKTSSTRKTAPIVDAAFVVDAELAVAPATAIQVASKEKSPKKTASRASKSKVAKEAVPTLPPAAKAAWNQMLFELLSYKAEHGDFNVRPTDEQHKPLLLWMQQQRRQFKVFQNSPETSSLTQEQVAVLDSIHFAWNTRGDEHWKRNYDRLKEFQLENGHTMVPRQSPIPKLGDWVTEQRRQFKALMEGKPSLLTRERRALLDEMGFVWQVRQRTGWQDRFDQLVEYKKIKGNTIVPQHYKEDRSLGKWVAKQREQYRLLCMGKHSFLTPDRVQQLESIGFVWSVKGRASAKDAPPAAAQANAEAEATATAVETTVTTTETQEEGAEAPSSMKEEDIDAAIQEASSSMKEQDIDATMPSVSV